MSNFSGSRLVYILIFIIIVLMVMLLTNMFINNDKSRDSKKKRQRKKRQYRQRRERRYSDEHVTKSKNAPKHRAYNSGRYFHKGSPVNDEYIEDFTENVDIQSSFNISLDNNSDNYVNMSADKTKNYPKSVRLIDDYSY